ncbi:hypothetical protein KP509_22G043000 [Ceratopteris richardii]|uniref:DUF1764-domain-containing protein n=1 Tax=Ceratopteris richardii TaxID=49495 RepID=A0A8T2S7K9_CERRI|nr:hypothetical protein KP509_22G043000 [Ceratopteris richardii]
MGKKKKDAESVASISLSKSNSAVQRLQGSEAASKDGVTSVKISNTASQAMSEANEIDQIFSQAKTKRKPEENGRGEDGGKEPKKKTQKNNKKQRGEVSGIEGAVTENASKNIVSSKARRKTSDGLTIYTEEELGFNRKDAGGTPLCPFDCDCCF